MSVTDVNPYQYSFVSLSQTTQAGYLCNFETKLVTAKFNKRLSRFYKEVMYPCLGLALI